MIVLRGAMGYLLSSAFVVGALLLVLAARNGRDTPLTPLLVLQTYALAQAFILPAFLLGRLGLWLARARRPGVFAAAAAGLALFVGAGLGVPEHVWPRTLDGGRDVASLGVEEIRALSAQPIGPGQAFAANLTLLNVTFWLFVGGVAGAVYRLMERGRLRLAVGDPK